VTLHQHMGVRILGSKQSFQLSATNILRSHSFRDVETPRSFNGVIESKKSAEWWNVVNDKNREWTDGPKHQESQTQQDYDLIHITLMCETRTRLSFLTRAAVLIENQREPVQPKHHCAKRK
jgi:hypothetical protein